MYDEAVVITLSRKRDEIVDRERGVLWEKIYRESSFSVLTTARTEPFLLEIALT